MKSLSRSQTSSQKNKHSQIPKTPLRFIAFISKPHKKWAVSAILAATAGQVFLTIQPYALQRIVDGFTSSLKFEEQIETFFIWAVIYTMLLAASFVCWRLSGFIGMEWLTRANATAYNELYAYISKHSHGYFANRFAGALSNKISNASDGSENLLDRTLWGWYPEIITLVVALFLLFSVDVYLMLALLITFIVMFFINLFLVQRRRPHVVAYAASSSKLRGEGVDYITNIAAARQYVRNDFELHRLSSSVSDRREKDLVQWRLSEWSILLNNAAIVLLVIGILIYVYILLVQKAITPGQMLLVLMMIGRVTHVIVFLGNAMNGFIRMYGEIEEGLEAVLPPHEIMDQEKAKKLLVKKGQIEWQNVDFEFGENKVFQDFNLTIQGGERIGLVGHSGAGKSTFVSLLLRQHDLTGGTLLIDGQNIADVTQDSLRQHIAVVPQEPMLFHRSIKENIAYGNPKATQKQIEEVAKKAQAHDFIISLPEGYDTLVGERGVKLSGGQKQRVAIARAMLKNAPILILDEATSALDSESEVAIQKALHELMEGKTVVAVAHRLSTLREMDRIIIMEGGKIIESGSHQELVQSGGVYARLWEHQAGGFLTE